MDNYKMLEGKVTIVMHGKDTVENSKQCSVIFSDMLIELSLRLPAMPFNKIALLLLAKLNTRRCVWDDLCGLIRKYTRQSMLHGKETILLLSITGLYNVKYSPLHIINS